MKRSLIIIIELVCYKSEQLNTYDLRKLGKLRLLSKLHGIISQCPAPPPKTKTPPTPIKDLPKREIEPFP